MLHVFLVTYDIRDPKRLHRVLKTMKGYGDRLQYSVFRCELPEANYVRMKERLSRVIDNDRDQVLLFRLGPADGIHTVQVEALGQTYKPPDRDALVV